MSPPVVDVEATDGQSSATIVARLGQWLDRVETATGRTPIIYTGYYFWRDNVGADFSSYPLWIANYSATCPDVPDPWTRWEFFQTSSTGRVAGIAGDVDTDLFNGDEARLLDFIGATPTCGDGRCSGDETYDTCPGDCPVCEPIPPLGRVVEEDELCFERAGDPRGWHPDPAVGSSGVIWTYCIVPPTDDHAWWRLDFEDAGTYRVEVHTPAPYNQSRMAPYTIRHDGVEERVVLDQSAVDGWQTLGEWGFAAAGDQFVHLEDGTGEPYADRVYIVFDAVRLTRLDPPVDRDAGVSNEDAAVSVDAGVSNEDAAVSVDAGRGRPLSAGCGCRAASGARSPWLLTLALGFAALSTRRSRRPRSRARRPR
ncbi:MAG: GH25 family lysozyme [Sandaracinaceae bacterium]|nr:GH25 family lysozyme [Sandaracinaceae bacterium]